MALTEKIRDICNRGVKIPYIAYARDYFQKKRAEEIQARSLEEIRDRILDSGIRQREQRFDRIISDLYS